MEGTLRCSPALLRRSATISQYFIYASVLSSFLAEQLERGKGKKKRQRAVGYISWLDGYV